MEQWTGVLQIQCISKRIGVENDWQESVLVRNARGVWSSMIESSPRNDFQARTRFPPLHPLTPFSVSLSMHSLSGVNGVQFQARDRIMHRTKMSCVSGAKSNGEATCIPSPDFGFHTIDFQIFLRFYIYRGSVTNLFRVQRSSSLILYVLKVL